MDQAEIWPKNQPQGGFEAYERTGIHSVARRRKFLRKAEDFGNFSRIRFPNTLNREFFAVRPNMESGH